MQYLMKLKLDRASRASTNLSQLRVLEPIKATEMSGKEVNLGDLKGKVWVAGYLYTLCPRGCAGLAEEMKRLQDKFGSHPKFQLVSISLNPETDTPERLRMWTEQQGYKGDNWWFLTGDGSKLRGYMTEQMKLPVAQIPKEQRQNEFDLWDHKLALVIVDDQMRFRSASDFSNFDAAETYREKMDEELTRLLKEAEGNSPVAAK